MSFLEAGMLLCFGAAWPFSIYKSFVSKRTGGKSFPFMAIVLVGYGLGIANKIVNNMDFVVYLYALNALMVGVDMALWIRNRNLEKTIQ